MKPKSNRTNVKESSHAQTRKERNERRHELSQKIRKSRRSHRLQLKRRLVVNTTTHRNDTIDGTTLDFSRVVQQWLNQPNDSNLLNQVLQSLTSSSSENNSLSPTTVQPFLNSILKVFSSMTQDSITAARILTNVAALDNGEPSDQSSYYGPSSSSSSNNSVSWCDGILSQTTFLPSCIHYLHTVQSNPHNEMARTMGSSCAWIVGNLAGDSPNSRCVLVDPTNGMVSTLMACIHTEVSRIKLQSSSTTSKHTMEDLELLRNALWALTNLARGAETSAFIFVQEGKDVVISGDLLVQILSPSLPTCFQISSGKESNQVTWTQIMIETYWLMAFLTAREEEAVQALLLGGNDDGGKALCHAMVTNFKYLSEVLTRGGGGGGNHSTVTLVIELATQMILPLIRTLGNIATCCDGYYVPTLLSISEGTGSSNAIPSSSLLCQAIVSWMQIIDGPSFPSSDLQAIAIEVTWMTGTLLCDVGYANHPSTTVACPMILIPLCQTLVHARTSLEWKRHLLWNLWNALSQPPEKDGMEEEEDTRPIRDEILKQVYQISQIRYTLVQSLNSSDVDVIHVSLKILDAMHRRLVADRQESHQWTVLQHFQEVDCLNALEGVCDSASAAYSYGAGRSWEDSNLGMEACAELSAELIDDFYQDDLEEEGSGELDGVGGGTAVDTNGQVVFRFGPVPSIAGATPAAQAPMNPSLGRGRGRVVPAWMQASHPI